MNYQLTYIVPTDVSDYKELEKIISAINLRIGEIGGVIKDPVSEIVESRFNENFRNDAEIKRIVGAHKVDIFKHRLAYPVKHHRYGYYISVVFSLDVKDQETILKNLSSELKRNKNIIRILVAGYNLDNLAKQMETREKMRTKQKEAATAQSDETKEAAVPESDAEEAEEVKPTEESKKSKIEDLDKKLEQILNA